ncbi:MAG: type II toxin-antitoxin system VapC family toxin [archaeon]
MKYYLDSNVFIYSILDTGTKGEAARKLLKAMENGVFYGATAPVSFEEIMFVVWKEKGRQEAVEAGESFLQLANMEMIGLEKGALSAAIEYVKRGMKPRDAVHCGAMKTKNLPEIVTEDSDFKKLSEMRKYGILEFCKKLKL